MQCCVPFCKSSSEYCESEGITFHKIPKDIHYRAAWLKALGRCDTRLPDSAVVCSQHFISDDMCDTECGIRQISTNAIPSTVQVCMMCLDSQSKLILMSKYNLEEAYENLVGHPLYVPGNLKQTLCVQCAQRLMNFSKFRDKSLRARSLMMELVERHELITIQHMELMNDVRNQLKSNIVKTVTKLDHYDLYITHSDEDKPTELDPTTHRATVPAAVKHEGFDPSLVNEDYPRQNTEQRLEENIFNASKVLKEEYNPDDGVTMEIKLSSDPLMVTPSTSNEQVDDARQQIKYEITFECTICLEEFFDEEAYNCHNMSMHMEENVNQDDPTADYCHTSVAPLPWGLVTNVTSHEGSSAGTIEPVIKKVKLSNASESEINESDVATYGSNKEYENCLKNILFQNLDIQTESKLTASESHVEDMLFSCTLCEYKTTRKGDLKIHTKSHSTEKLFFSCQLCLKAFARNGDLARHMKRHTEDKPFSCKLCEYKCKVKNTLVEHMKIHSSGKPFSCKSCEYKFTRKSDLVRHTLTHTGVKSFSCDICDHKMARKCDLAKHLLIHTGEKRFSCQSCDFKFARKGDLLNHIKIHTGERPFSCNSCEYKFARKNDLVRHTRTHTGEKSYSCDNCDHKVARKGDLASHMLIHTGEKRFSCQSCDFKFARKGDLVNHTKIHTREKPFACSMCEYKCNRNKTLVDHIRTHTGEKPFSCELCGYKCINRKYLTKHMKTHTGKKSFTCELCKYNFARNRYLSRHMQTVHNINNQ